MAVRFVALHLRGLLHFIGTNRTIELNQIELKIMLERFRAILLNLLKENYSQINILQLFSLISIKSECFT
jgi:hypothetical protein